MKTSKMSESIEPSLTRKLFNMALKIGDDVINLTLGDPDVLPPEEIRIAACEAIMGGKTRYSENAGLQKVRNSYAEFFVRKYGFSINPSENIIATVGGMEALFLSIVSMVDKDDEVIVLAPYYVNYVEMLKMCGGKAIIVNRLYKSEEEILEEILGKITTKTVGIIINNPCNPVGDILSNDLLKEIAKIVTQKDLFVISDEVYNGLVYDNKKVDSIVGFEGMKERTIIIDSCSKRFAMTGWRMGFAVAPAQIIKCMVMLQENIVACAPLPSQYAAIKAYKEDFDYSYIQKTYQKRRDIVFKATSEMHNLRPIYPEATFYCFVDISQTGFNAEEFAYLLLEKAHVAVVPGNAYGESYSNFIRIAFTVNEDLLEEAMERIRNFVNDICPKI